MEESIAAYYKKTIFLGDLIHNLESLPMAMKGVSEDWQNDVVDESHDMEVTYASMLDYGRESFTDYEREVFEKNITNVIALIEQFKKEYNISTKQTELIYPK